MNQARFDDLLSALPRLTIALVGDLFLDRYLELTTDVEYSIETGLEAYQIQRVRNAPGALGTVMNNLAALGVGKLLPVTVIGEDGHGFDLRRSLQGLPVDQSHIIADAQRLTPTYTKPLRPRASQESPAPSVPSVPPALWEELNRLDVRTREPLEPKAEDALLSHLEAAWNEADGLIVLDQISDAECGVVTERVRRQLAVLASSDRNKLMIVDSREFLATFTAGDLKGNRREVLQAASMNDIVEPDAAALRAALEQLRARHGQRIFCTDGPEGIWIADEHGVRQLPGRVVEGPIDIVGAGDTVTAALTACLLGGATAEEAAEVANTAASISIQKIGQTGVATPVELHAAIES